MISISKSTLDFLNALKQNNNREWFAANKTVFDQEQKKVKNFFNAIQENLKVHDTIERLKMYRIYRDVRFSNDKTPYKSHLACNIIRETNKLRGGYYVHISPGDTFLAAGFWEPNKDDLFRIRKEFEMDATEILEITTHPTFVKHFGTLKGDALKSAPRGFDKAHPQINLINMKQFYVMKSFSDEQVLSENFLNEIDASFKAIRPFFDYMSEVLTTDLNGISLLD